MKIIKHGKKFDDGKPFRGKCYCGCEVEVKRNEIQYQSADRPGDEGYHYVTCPECKGVIYFRDKRLE